MIPFVKFKWAAISLSIFIIVGAYYKTFYVFNGFSKGIDFAGGIKLEISLNDKVTIESLRDFFSNRSINAVVQKTDKGSANMAKIEIGGQEEKRLEEQAEKEKEALDKANYSINSVDYIKYLMLADIVSGDSQKIEFVGVDHVGPTVGDYLKDSAIKLLLVTLVLITLYVTFRFRFQFAVGALIALLHDLFMTLGIIGFLEIPLSIPVIAALLTILGYSINDTIVIYDRIRENVSGHDNIDMGKAINQSINESLSRTIITSVTTLVAVAAIYFLTDDMLKDMALVLIFGIIIGTYSSPFIASPVVLIWDKFAKKT
ncbi:MAG: protein translocase subunit SecF [Spirochaetia bacterium]|nr:protein translocase subunit SecF [Spirochaetia bacterium]